MNSSRFFGIIGFFAFAGLVSTWILDLCDHVRLGMEPDLVFNSINLYRVVLIGLMTAMVVEVVVCVDAWCSRRPA